MPGSPRITAIVLTWNSAAHVVPCVTSLLVSRSVSLSVLVVDNASTDATIERLQSSGLPVTIRQTGANLGYAGGNNVGIEQAMADGAEYVFVLNDDTEVAPDLLATLVRALEADPSAAAVAPTIVHETPADLVWWAGGSFRVARGLARHDGYGELASAGSAGPPRAVDSLCGCGILFRRAALEALGGFRADFFMYGEDVEWSLRARRAGWRLLHVPQARMVHKVSYPEGDPTPIKILLRDRNRRRMVRAHYRWDERFRFMAWFYPTRLVHLVRYLSRGDLARARAILRGATAR
ncbi:MAG: glycosyltransferase family 2 protein [Gemmatimonadetes bacterium]|nr:glycosyltransferase family 2 protein [Gemmatimonadota bacterium]